MAIKFLHNIDLKQNQLLNARVHVASSAPTGSGKGSIWLNSSTNELNFHNGSGFVSVMDDTNTNQLTTFTLTADSGTNQTVGQGETLDIAGGASITTSVGNTNTVTIDVTDNTIGADELNVSGDGTSSQFLRSDGDGTFSWAVPTDTNTDTNTQNVFTSSFVDSTNDCILRLTKSGASSGTQDIKFVAGSNISLTPSGTNLTIAATNTNTQLSTEQVQDIVGGMFSGNTETRISATYQDGDGTIDLVVNDMTANTNTQNVFTSSFVDSDANAILRLTKSGAASGTQDITFVAGSNITLTPDNANQMTITSTDTNTQLSTSQVRGKISGSGVISYNSSTGVITSSATATNAANVRAALNNAMASNTLTIGDGSTTTTIPGNLTVTGTTTTNNVEVVSTSNGVVFEGSAADANEGTLLAGTLSADRTYTLPNKSGTVAMTSDITGTNSNTNTGDQLVFKSVASDSGTAVADTTTDTLTIAGGSNVTTSVSGDTLTIAATDTNTQLSTEAVQDIVGAMFSNNTETRIAATYQDGDGTIDLAVDDMTANTNTQNAYSTSVVSSSGIKLRLSGSGAAGNTTDDVKFAAGSNVSISRTDASTITIAATDTNTNTTYSAGNGISLSGTTFSTDVFEGSLAAATSGITKSQSTYTVTHGLGNKRVNVVVTEASDPFEQVFTEVKYGSAAGDGTVLIGFGQSVTDGVYNVTITR
jgi:23S rRNA U2552 (ribose-2'-O)-methylase RlmE/FtsJ